MQQEATQKYSLMRDGAAPEESKVSSINRSTPAQVSVRHPQVAPPAASEFDDLHQMLITQKNSGAAGSQPTVEYGVPHNRNQNNSNVSQTSSNHNDMAFNDSAYRVG